MEIKLNTEIDKVGMATWYIVFINNTPSAICLTEEDALNEVAALRDVMSVSADIMNHNNIGYKAPRINYKRCEFCIESLRDVKYELNI